MGFGAYAILVVFGAFILLLILSPSMSCFGKRIRSPFYPLLRKRRAGKRASGGRSPLGADEKKSGDPAGKKPSEKTEDYGFRLD